MPERKAQVVPDDASPLVAVFCGRLSGVFVRVVELRSCRNGRFSV
jgi:hypothetical protein